MGISELLKRFETDEGFSANYKGLADADAVIEQARKDGYSVTKEEIEALRAQKQNAELSDDELGAVAGGGVGIRPAVSPGNVPFF